MNRSRKQGEHGPTSRERAWVLPALLGVAAAVRLYGIQWGLPDLFEEATPHRIADAMWGWGAPGGVDLNPHFFNYPSLTMYVHFVVEGVVFAALRLGGVVSSTMDFHAWYMTDPTVAVIASRMVGVAFGVLTVYATYRAAQPVLRRPAPAVAAAFVALITAHVSRSQMIEVDVPLTCFTMLFFVFAVRLLERPTRRNYLYCGVMMGLATATKYTGAFLLPSLVVAHVLARRRGRGNTSWRDLAISAGALVSTFVVCSPFVVLDASAALADIGTERAHMRAGHFGLTGPAAWLDYARMLTGGVLTGGMLGWPLAIAAAAGLVRAVAMRRRPWAVVLAAFVVPYLVGVSTWEMRAPRYLLPVLPGLVLFATHALHALAARRWLATAAVLVAAVPVLAGYPAHLRALGGDSRTLAREWVEGNVPAGSFVVTELYGPELAGGPRRMQMRPELRRIVQARASDRPVYAIQPIPLFQVEAERTGVYYRMALYRDADIVITTGAVRSRYESDPVTYGAQLAFYDSLDARGELLRRFEPRGRSGSQITVYRMRRGAPLARRNPAGPSPLPSADPATPSAGMFFVNLGLNYELFGHHHAALAAYQLATAYRIYQPTVYEQLMRGIVRCLIAQGKRPQARRFLTNAERNAPPGANRETLQRIRRDLIDGNQ